MHTGPTILLYTDRPDFFERRDTYFNRRGVEVFCAMDRTEAARVLAARRVDLVLTRGVPEDMSVSEARELIPHGVPVIVLATENDDPSLLSSYERSPSTSVLRPPYEESVMDTTAQLLNVSVRRYLRLLVQIQVKEARGGSFGFSSNISASGMLIETKQPMEIGSDLALSFLVPGAAKMTQVRGRIVRHAPTPDKKTFRYGLRFLDLADEDAKLIVALASGAN